MAWRRLRRWTGACRMWKLRRFSSACEVVMATVQAGAMNSALHLSGRCVLRSDLIDAQRDAMYELLCDHFEGVTRSVFENDLAEKDWAVLLEDSGGRIR